MIQAQSLPPGKSVYDYPALAPGQEPTLEQQQQMSLAQIAGIILAVSVAKGAIEDAVTNQLVAVLRTVDLATEAGVKAFIAAAQLLLPTARQKAREVTWSGFVNRANVVGIEFDATLPEIESIPQNLRYSRGSSIENAYSRVAEEYLKNLQRTKDDPIIAELVAQFEAQGLTPLPRPDNLSNDAVKEVAESDETWVQAFRRAEEEARKEARRGEPEAQVPEAVAEELGTTPADGEWHQVDKEEFSGDDTADAQASLDRRAAERAAAEQAERKREEAANSSRETEASSGRVTPPDDEVDDDGEEEVFELTDREIEEIIERYAEHKAEERVERMVSQEVQGTSRNTHQVAMQRTDPKHVVGYRRIVHPELSKYGRSCGLCIVASTMMYTRGDLMPIHSGCNCETAEVYMVDGVEFDPGQQINLQDLAVFYDEAGKSTHGWSLKKQRYEVFDHPEYGPTLINATSKKARENATEIEFERRG